LNITLEHLQKTVTIKKNKKFNKEMTKEVIKMFANGILHETPKNQLKNLLNDDLEHLHWIIIRFCELCGILLSDNCIHYLQKDLLSFQFSNADIVDTFPVIKCPAILDYYTGHYYYIMARKEDSVGARLTYLKAALERLDNVKDLNFYKSNDYFMECLFETVKLDHNCACDWERVTTYFKSQFHNSSREKLNYLSAILWQWFLDSTKDVPHPIEIASGNNFVTKFYNCLDHTQQTEVTRRVQEFSAVDQRMKSHIESKKIEITTSLNIGKNINFKL